MMVDPPKPVLVTTDVIVNGKSHIVPLEVADEIRKLRQEREELFRMCAPPMEQVERSGMSLREWAETRLVSIEKNNDALTKIEQLLYALRKYGRHGDNLTGEVCERNKHGDSLCTCGLGKILWRFSREQD